jgi:hypothetical protein
MTKTTRPGIFQPHTLALAIALGTIAPAHAVNFNIGEIEGQLDSSISVGASWSMRSADRDYIGEANGGTGFTQTGDDGRLNFKKGETFSKIFKGIHDLELKYGDTGVFVRGKYWYDFELKDEQRLWKDIDDSNRKQAAQSSGAEILDAFVYHNYSIGELPGSVRAGKQVVSWGESTFIGNSINSINPIDAAAFRRPGAEIKEGLIPVNMFYVSQSLTDQLSAEAFYQIEWDQTVADNCGTFFASADVVADGCDNNYTILGPSSIASIQSAKAGGFGPDAQAAMAEVNVTDEGLIVPRGGDRDAKDSGRLLPQLPQPHAQPEHAERQRRGHHRRPDHPRRRPGPADPARPWQLLPRVPRGHPPVWPELLHLAAHRHRLVRRAQLPPEHAAADQHHRHDRQAGHQRIRRSGGRRLRWRTGPGQCHQPRLQPQGSDPGADHPDPLLRSGHGRRSPDPGG